MVEVTLKDLHDYILVAGRNAEGMHIIPRIKDCKLHIYEGYKQVNVHINDKPVANFVFDELNELVTIYPVDENEVADYNNGMQVVTNADILNNRAISSVITSHIDPNGSGIGTKVIESLIKIIAPWKESVKDHDEPVEGELLKVIEYILNGYKYQVFRVHTNGEPKYFVTGEHINKRISNDSFNASTNDRVNAASMIWHHMQFVRDRKGISTIEIPKMEDNLMSFIAELEIHDEFIGIEVFPKLLPDELNYLQIDEVASALTLLRDELEREVSKPSDDVLSIDRKEAIHNIYQRFMTIDSYASNIKDNHFMYELKDFRKEIEDLLRKA